MTSAPADRAVVADLARELFPGSRLVSMQALRGGLSALMHAVTVELPGGARERFVLRRYSSNHPMITAERAANEFRTLQLLEQAGVPAPRPLWFEPGGRFGGPAMALSYLRGRAVMIPRLPRQWVAELSHGMQLIHSVTPDQHDISFLEDRGYDFVHNDLINAPRPAIANDPQAQRAAEILRQAFDSIEWLAPCLIHDDYWPGNVVMHRGKLSGVIDWSFAAIGDARQDIAQCCLDLSLIHGPDLAEVLVESYQASSPLPVREIWFFHLLLGLHCMEWLPQYDFWLKGYHDFGLTHITYEVADARLRAFMETALSRAGG